MSTNDPTAKHPDNIFFKGEPPNKPADRMDNEADMICETLVREIARGPRWVAILDLWRALQTVRAIADDLKAEQHYIRTADTAGASAPVNVDELLRNVPK